MTDTERKRTFKTIGLIGKYADPSVGDALVSLHEYFLGNDCHVLLDESTAAVFTHHEMESVTRTQLGEQCDLIIIVGGDGTLLSAARSLVGFGVPLLGINLGHLGFLVDLCAIDVHKALDEIMAGEYTEENRFLIISEIERDGDYFGGGNAFNDVVIHKADVARMIEIETYVDNKFMHSMHADGLIISTPTGSTAYSLSGGGPILYPSLNVLQLVPICPHTMSNRPVVISGESEIDIVVSDHFSTQAQVTYDGQINFNLMPGDHVKIMRHPKHITILHPKEYDYFEILRAKLRWGEKLRN
ncbi:MAG: NAD(+) kinase [gamma proteobacterium symbiont of Bathyaustriella thionipta]|nr:NAD(+) kinase [gamma proteobacterium symbiont of Bathyaustriella thionipta]MCU7948968.1 NAD(+) kinase [gamma proteobacterium symbiont of Bathyaustriella thionipta]MCU7953970.1 NAD(+) kinase [gamma proteobacterium symbiont of Bathyaustriella thionipta]MCU7955513.1 NAD(+) kinase [gamma proteobacterium symbiont of Bathyaustriella thionipta]MCU7965694.1 NAD(+) kinase [gamma proteobacterium symbiont of Bathyaustriella thionipta]